MSGQIVKLVEDAFEDDLFRYRSQGSEPMGWLARRMGYYTTIRDKADGRFMPIYDNEMDLKAIRAACWLLDVEHPVAISIRNRLIEYTISTGYEWSVAHSLKGVEKYLKIAIDRVLQNSSWCDLEAETFQRMIRDGEAIGYLTMSEGDICIEQVEPECLTEPLNYAQLEDYYDIYYPSSWSFGVHTEQGKSKPKGYHFVFNQDGTEWDYLPASRVYHWKRNTGLRAKRGCPDNAGLHRWLRSGEKVLGNTATGAAIQAAIAYIVEHAGGVPPEKISAIAAARQNNLVTKVDTIGSSYQTNKIRAGQVVDIRNGGKYHAGLLGSNASTIWIEVMEACMRFGGLPYAMPEHMVTGFAGNNNRASSDTAESPFIQGRYFDQHRRSGHLKGLLEMIAEAVIRQSGRWDWNTIKGGLEVTVTPPDIVTRDIKATTEALAMQKQLGWVSDRQAMGVLQYSYDDVKSQIDDEQKSRPQDWASVTNPAGVGIGEPTVVGRGRRSQRPADQRSADQQSQQGGQENA